MPEQVEGLLKKYQSELDMLPGNHIEKVILYGSYARGDFKENSDIDIMILVDLEDFKDYEDRIFDVTYDFNVRHSVDIMPIVQNIEHFNYWKDAYMFYCNISKEGVDIWR